MESDRVDVDELRAQIAELEGRVRDLSEFTSLVAHDLDAPARHIEAFAALLERDHGDSMSDAGLEYIAFMCSGAHRLRQLVLALLEYSRIGAEAIEAEVVDVDDLVRSVLRDLDDEISITGTSVEVGPVPAVLASRPLLGLVLRNIVRNAVQFRDAERHLHISISGIRTGENVDISVDDTGRGIEVEHHEQVFHPLRRMIQVDDAPYSLGLGLAHAERLVTAMGGRMWVTSEVGVGSRFHVQLPTTPD